MEVNSTVNTTFGMLSAITSRMYKPLDIALAVDIISPVSLLLATQRSFHADH